MMDIKWVEFQIDRKKLLIFAEFYEYVTFSNYVREVCFLIKNYLKKKHNTRYALRIYIQRKLMSDQVREKFKAESSMRMFIRRTSQDNGRRRSMSRESQSIAVSS